MVLVSLASVKKGESRLCVTVRVSNARLSVWILSCCDYKVRF